jgi:CRP/FNR family transcriptional regulator, anaerobic regulatory protein
MMDLSTITHTKEWNSIRAIATEVKLKKETLFLGKGDRSDKEIFVESGIVRGFIVDESGNEKSTSFFRQGEFVSTNTLRTLHGISMYNYQALCPAVLLVFDSKELRQLLSETNSLTVLGKQIKERELMRLSNRDECLMEVKAANKYLKFIAFYPDLESRISQRHIASYLGITPVSLSRIKKILLSGTVIK